MDFIGIMCVIEFSKKHWISHAVSAKLNQTGGFIVEQGRVIKWEKMKIGSISSCNGIWTGRR